jgi:hypothetical protein
MVRQKAGAPYMWDIRRFSMSGLNIEQSGKSGGDALGNSTSASGGLAGSGQGGGGLAPIGLAGGFATGGFGAGGDGISNSSAAGALGGDVSDNTLIESLVINS